MFFKKLVRNWTKSALPLQLFFLQQSHNPRFPELPGLPDRCVAPPVRWVEVHLAGLDEVLDTADMILADSKVEGSSVVVVRGVHIDSGEEEPL